MPTFSQQNRKLQKIFNDIKSNKSALDNRRNEQILLNFFKSTNKAQISISDTGWIAKAPDSNDLKTIHKGALLPESLSVNHSDQLEVPDFLLPYIDVQMMIKTAPDSILTSYDKYTTENYINDYIIVKGDGGNLFSGPYFPNFISPSSDAIFPFANTKKIWNIEIFYTNPSTGDEWRAWGELRGIRTEENLRTCGTPPSEVEIVDTFECRYFEQPTYPNYHNITAFSETGFTGVGDFTTRSFTSGPPGCTTSESTTTQINLSKTFSAMEDYIIRILGAEENITQGTPGVTGTFSVIGSEITSINITSTGYRLYYSSSWQKEMKASGSTDIVLTNLPNTTDGDTLPYSSITLQRNLEPLSSILNTEIDEDVFLFSFETGGNNIRKDFALFKIQDGNTNHFPYYHMKLSVGATILSPAVIDDPDPHVKTQSDAYGVSGTTYARNTNTTGLTSESYITEKQDVQYRIMIIVKNPFWYQEIRKYGTSEQFG